MTILFLRIGAIAIDLIASASLIVAVAIVWGLSGTFHIGPWLASVTSPRNPVVIGACALVIRSFDADTPFLGFLTISALRRRALAASARFHDALVALTLERAIPLLFGVLAASLALKLILAGSHPGFWTGDDVEIHEMTFAKLFGYGWPAHEFRSPFFPLGFIYPVQALLVKLGQGDPARLVFAGRTVVAMFTIATLWLTFHVARVVFGSIPIAALTVLILATNKLHVMTGTTELPRPVASLFVVAAFGLLSTSRRESAACAAGALITVAAAMRFSEGVFVIPAVAQLVIARRWRGVLMFGLGVATVGAVAFGAVDFAYWGEPFFSARNIWELTLIRRLSTRGFQPWYEYVRAIPSWTNIAVAAFAVYGTIKLRLWTLGIWAWVPVVLLSLLPHKEPRYLVPILPYFAMLASAGLWHSIVWLQQSSAPLAADRRERAALPLVMTVFTVFLTEPMDYVLPRSDDGIAIARYIAAHGPTDGVLAEPAWNIGGRIYLPLANPLLDVDFEQMRERSKMDAMIRTPGLAWLVLQNHDVQCLQYESLITAAGFNAITLPGNSSTYRIYHRR